MKPYNDTLSRTLARRGELVDDSLQYNAYIVSNCCRLLEDKYIVDDLRHKISPKL